MAETINVEKETEKRIALQAIETYRALQHAVKTAPHGKGLATVEAVVHEKGFAQLQKMYQAALAEHPEVKKRDLLFDLFLREQSVVPLRDAQVAAWEREDGYRICPDARRARRACK